jgi:hypothetical protein
MGTKSQPLSAAVGKILPQNAGIGSPGGYHQGIARLDAVAEIRGV